MAFFCLPATRLKVFLIIRILTFLSWNFPHRVEEIHLPVLELKCRLLLNHKPSAGNCWVRQVLPPRCGCFVTRSSDSTATNAHSLPMSIVGKRQTDAFHQERSHWTDRYVCFALLSLTVIHHSIILSAFLFQRGCSDFMFLARLGGLAHGKRSFLWGGRQERRDRGILSWEGGMSHKLGVHTSVVGEWRLEQLDWAAPDQRVIYCAPSTRCC